MGGLDTALLVVYLVTITVMGVWTARRVRGLGDFFMPRRFGKAMMITHAFGTGTASDQAVSVASATAQRGLSGIWYQWLWLFATPFYWLIAPIMRRFRAVTTADVLTLRFDRSVAGLFAVVGIASMSVKIGVMLKGAGALVEAGTGELIDTDLAIAIITGLFVLYGAAGGLGAAIVTDFVQGILTVVFSFILLPFVLYEVGGMDGIRAAIRQPEMLSLVAPEKITLFFIIMMGVQALVGIVAQPHIMGVCAAGKSEWEGRIGFVVGNLIKRLCTIAWALTAIGAVAWYLENGVAIEAVRTKEFGDRIYGEVARQFLPAVLPGLLGVFLASLLAAVMSSCDSFMISSAGLFTENIYRPLRPQRSEGHYVLVGRIAALVIVAGGVAYAHWATDVVRALEVWFKIAPMTGIVFWMCLFWRRMTVAGAWASTLSGFGAWYVGARQEFDDPWLIVFYMAVAVFAGVVVSLLTKPVPHEKLDRFYTLMRTPIVDGEEVDEPCTLPRNAAPPRPTLLSGGGFEIPKPSRTSVIGFFVVWGAVAALIGGFTLIVTR